MRINQRMRSEAGLACPARISMPPGAAAASANVGHQAQELWRVYFRPRIVASRGSIREPPFAHYYRGWKSQK